MKTLQEWVDMFNKPAYIFHNGFKDKYMYFIPICEYDDITVNPTFNAFSYTQIKKDEQVICDIKNLINERFLNGNEYIFVIPIEFDDDSLPEENIIYPSENS